MKILYVCPFSHYSGHHPYAAATEPKILSQAGADVTLVTFCGVTNDPKIDVPHYRVIPHDWTPLQWLRKNVILRWFIMLGETIVTLCKAMRLYRKLEYDVMYVRDGEPFLFLPFILSALSRSYKWVISLTGANLFAPKPSMFKFHENPFIYFYTSALRVVNGKMWRPLYRWCLERDGFVFTTQNEEARKSYSEHQNGIFNGKVVCIPLGTTNSNVSVSKSTARTRLRLPENALILLSFGAPHSGKDTKTVVKAMMSTPEIFTVYAGTQSFSLGSNPTRLTELYGLESKTAIFDYYIPEEEKPPFFYAADALILSYTKAFKSTSSMLWEAAKYHLPVISSDANLLGKMVEEYGLGLLFEAENVDSLIDAIKRFEDLKLVDAKLMEAGRQRFIDDYSTKGWVEGILGTCKQLLEVK